MGITSWRRAPRRVWGWSVYLETPEPKESAALRQAAAEVTNGKSVFIIAKEWNQRRDLPTVHGGAWSGIVIANILRRRTNEQGLVPLLDHETYAKVVAALDRPRAEYPSRERVQPRPRRRRRRTTEPRVEPYTPGKYVVTQVARCGVCDAPAGAKGKLNTTGHPRLACRRAGRGAVFDGERHPGLDLLQAEAAAHDAVIAAMSADLHLPAQVVEQQYDALPLQQRREAALRYITVTINPGAGSKSLGVLKIEPRS